MSPYSHRCNEQCVRILADYPAGASAVVLSRRTGYSPAWVYACLRNHGVARRPPGLRFSQWGDDAKHQWEGGKTLAEIAAPLGLSKERVRQVLNVLGVDTGLRPRGRRHVCSDVCQAVLSAPLPLAVLPLAKAIGVSGGRILWAARQHHLPRRGQGYKRHCCTDRCRIAAQALLDGVGISAAFVQAGWSEKTISPTVSRYRTHHPEWSWPGPEWWLRNEKEKGRNVL